MSCYKLICYRVKYKISKSKVIECILLKLELLLRVSRYFLVKRRSVYKGVVLSLYRRKRQLYYGYYTVCFYFNGKFSNVNPTLLRCISVVWNTLCCYNVARLVCCVFIPVECCDMSVGLY
jgi:hypothetical protein